MYSIQVSYKYISCGSNAASTDFQLLLAANGSVFTFTGAGPYAEYVMLVKINIYIA